MAALQVCRHLMRRTNVAHNQSRALSGVADLPTEAKAAGSLFVWGRIDDNRLGMKLPDNMFTVQDIARGPSLQPMWNPNLRDVVQVVCRGTKSFALTKDGSVYSWGTCENLSLGHGDTVTRVGLPKKLEALAGIRIVSIDANETSAAAVSEEGEVFTWGWGGSFWGGNGGLGHGDNVTQPRPAYVEALGNCGADVASVAVGAVHMIALCKDGSVYSWGNAEFGRCGNGKRSQLLPEPVELLQPHPIAQISAGRDFSFAVAKDGVLWSWGKNDAAQQGLGAGLIADLNTMEAYPVKVELEGDEAAAFNGRVARVAAGNNHSCAVTKDGAVYQWGARTFLQPTATPTVTSKSAEGRDVHTRLVAVDVAAGESVSSSIDANGRLATWGKLSHAAMLGHGAGLLNARNPAVVEALTPVPITQASFGAQHAAAIVGIPRSLGSAK